MGARKRNRAEQRKEEQMSKSFAVLRNCPTSPRKMRLVTDLIRGMEVNHALDVLKFSQKEASKRVEKLLFRPSQTGRPKMKVRELRTATCLSAKFSLIRAKH